MTKLQQLHTDENQSPWLDNLRRAWITGGELAAWVERGVRGITSNPSIFQKAIGQSDDYDEQLADLMRDGTTVEDAYWELVTADIEDALRILAPVHAADPDDGFVSVEVAPELALDTAGTISAARELHARIDEPNLHVKIPGTAEGVPAIREMVSEGRNINVTGTAGAATTAPDDIVYAAEQLARHYAISLKSRIPDRALSIQNDFGTVRLSTPAPNRASGLPEIDAILERRRHRIGTVA